MIVFANLSPGDLSIVFIVALLVFGPKKLPDVGRQVGAALRELRKLSGEFTGTFSGLRDEMTGINEEARRSISGADFSEVASPVEHLTGENTPRELPAPYVGRRGLKLSTVPPDQPAGEDQAK
ncbi:MAG: twin-arginine translocase TatA/TatE family subunit [Capsulimonadaceae bacterium]|nr:twin-arginine translocase TatA/TatE family subunit [Capsulimonadaceae bacterium]